MDPAKSNEVILILDIKEFFLVKRLTRISIAFLLWDDDVRDTQCVLRLCGGYN